MQPVVMKMKPAFVLKRTFLSLELMLNLVSDLFQINDRHLKFNFAVLRILTSYNLTEQCESNVALETNDSIQSLLLDIFLYISFTFTPLW